MIIDPTTSASVSEGTSILNFTNQYWSDYHAIGKYGTSSSFESNVLFQEDEYPVWKSWNLTDLTRQWVNDDTSNFGVLLWATNEATDGYELRFKSALASSNQLKLEVTCTEDPLKTLFFLKDHLGSIRAVVDDTAGVVGYDDYDPWGYILANRSSATARSGGQNAAKNKFTGKQWDDDFGLDFYQL